MGKRGVYTVLQENHSSSGSAVYQIRRGGDGVVYCTCPGWRFNKCCKHLDAWLAGNGVPQEVRAECKADNTKLQAIIDSVVEQLTG